MRRFVVATGLFLLLAGCEVTPASPRTRITDTTPTESGTAFTLTNRDVRMRLTLPPGWSARPMEEGDDIIARDDPTSAFGIAMYVLTIPDGQTPTDQPWRRGALQAIGESLKAKAPMEYEWIGQEMTEIAGSPALQTTVKQKDGATVRDTYFFYEQYMLTASLVTDGKELDAVWPDVGNALQQLVFTPM
jgi:hypothetical protein